MAALERLLEAFHKGYTHVEAGVRSYEALLTRSADDPPPGYRLKTRSASGVEQQAYAQDFTERLVALADEIIESEADLQKGSPRPRPAMRIVPDV